ncbi:MAG: DUF262 domain-containing protein [Natronohydrobacter sp.]|nr:DUF262 domain-containing protein [Natronohydrobacter sp.]
MIITTSNYSIMEILAMLDRRELVVNRDYQRGSAIWPNGPSSYFIDTILEGFPFPKIYMYDIFDKKKKTVRKEIVDGQQRISAIVRFHNNEFALGQESRHAGKRYDELEEDIRDAFLAYVVSVDVIRNTAAGDILQMFRRMNAYTLPLNEAEKRHSSFQGQFKWFVNDLCDEFNDFFVEYGVLTNRQIIRMADAALLTECIDGFENGVTSSSPAALRQLYTKYDESFILHDDYKKMLQETIHFIIRNFSALRGTFMMKPYAFYSLVIALLHAKYGIESITREWEVSPIGTFAVDPVKAETQLLELARAHEAKEIDGPHRIYVWGCTSTTDRKLRRTARIAPIMRILGMKVANNVDNELT